MAGQAEWQQGMGTEALRNAKSEPVALKITFSPCPTSLSVSEGSAWKILSSAHCFKCPNVLDSAWDGFLLPKGVSSVCTRHCPRNRGDSSPGMARADPGHDLALVLGGQAGLGTKGFVLPVPFPRERQNSAGRDPGQEV